MQSIDKPMLAYIAGAYMGDGCFSETKKRALIQFVMADRDILETIAAFHAALTGHRCSPSALKNRPHLTRLQLTDTALARQLRTWTGDKERLPRLIGTATKRDFIAGLMDTDGHVRCGRTTNGRWNRFYLSFVNSGKWFPDFLALLTSLGVKCGVPTLKGKYKGPEAHEADCWQVGINLRSFTDAGLYFRCIRKQEVIHSYLRSVRHQSY